MRWAATMSNRLFFCVRQPCSRFPAGVVVVEAPKGVRLDFWMPVFM